MKTFLFLLLPIIGISQHKVEIKDGSFYTFTTDGRDNEVKIEFKISQETIDFIKASESYQNTLSDTAFLKANKEKRGIKDPVALHLMSKVNGCASSTRFKLKNKTSFSIESNAKGFIYVSKEDLAISFPFSGQNGYGNSIFSKTICVGKETFITD